MRNFDIFRIVLIAFIGVFGFGVASQNPNFSGEPRRDAASVQADDFAGSASCAGCHASQTEAWRGSHHAHAMFEASRPGAMLGDFGGTTVETSGRSARFSVENGRYFVETDDKDGQTARFAITHSFGWTPLQQYLVTMPDGRLQVLPWAWDTRPAGEGGQHWFHVYGDEAIRPGDSRHWTGLQQNWNHMCAECHTTGFDKNYSAETMRFDSRWSELGVTCESCHGPAGGHLRWARTGAPAVAANKGFGHPQPKVAAFPAAPNDSEVDVCARCHSRRSPIASKPAPGSGFLDAYRPVLLAPDMFEHDGQMKDEVFNDHAFRQSLMYAKGVTCGHCHDPHSGRLRQAGAAVCTQCHEPARFAAHLHTGHSDGAGAPDCIACHMPVRTYMQVDRRHDHSFRIPRPDLTEKIGTPNTCQSCHAEKAPAWATAAIASWHGSQRKGFQTFGSAFHLSRAGDPDSRAELQRLANAPEVPAVVRATALGELANWPADATDRVIRETLSDADAFVRAEAVSQHSGLTLAIRRERLLPLLTDPVRLVRMNTASALADLQPSSLNPNQATALISAIAEYEASLLAESDRPEAWVNLGNLRLRQGRIVQAEAAYRRALLLEPASIPAAVNLADVLRRANRESEAQETLETSLGKEPRASALHYALGLSLLRQGLQPQALDAFAASTTGESPVPRHFYAYGLALQQGGRMTEARDIWKMGSQKFPNNFELLGILLQDAMRQLNWNEARLLGDRLVRLRPDDVGVRQLVQRLQGQLNR